MTASTKGNRYSLQTVFWGLGEEGQQRLAESSVLVAGLGALGGYPCPADGSGRSRPGPGGGS